MPAMKRPAATIVKSVAAKAAKPSGSPPAMSRASLSATPKAPEVAQPAQTEMSVDVCDELGSIKEALRQAEGYPQPVLDMLVASLPSAAGPKEQRHYSQEQVLDMIEAVLDSHTAAARSRVEAAGTAVSAAAKECETRQQAVHQAESAADAAAAVVAERKADLATVLECFSAAQSKQNTAELAEAEWVRAAEAVSKSLASLQTVQAQLEVLRTGSPEPSRAAVAKDVVEALKAYNIGDSLVASLSSVLPKEPEQISAFDKVVIDQLDAELRRVAKELEQEDKKATEARDSGEQARLAATVDAEAAKEKAQAAAAEVEEAENDAVKAGEATRAAAAAVEENGAKSNAAREELLCMQRKLEALQSGAVRRFQEVRDLSLAPKPVDARQSEAPESTVAPAEPAASEGRVAEESTEVTHVAPGGEAAVPPQALGAVA